MTRTEFREIETDQLIIDPAYQRPLRERWVTARMDNWDDRLAGVLEVSDREDDTYAVFDGQHRTELAKRRGEPKVLRCLVHVGLSVEEEAALWVRLNRDRQPASQLDMFRADVRAGEADAVAIAKLVENRGWEIGKLKGGEPPHRIEAVALLRKLYGRRNGPKLLDDTLQYVSSVWSDDPKSNNGEFLGGVAAFVDAFGPSAWTERTMSRVAGHSPLVYLRRANAAKDGFAGGGGLRKAISEELRRQAQLRPKEPTQDIGGKE